MGCPKFLTTSFLNLNLSDSGAAFRRSRQSFRRHHGLLIEVGDCRLSFNQHDDLDMITRVLKDI